jgi:hypothetical protein
MKLLTVVAIVCLGCLMQAVVCQKSAYNLKRDILRYYDSQSRPVKNSTTTMKICVGLYVLQIVGLSEKSQVKRPYNSTVAPYSFTYFESIFLYYYTLKIMQANIQMRFAWVGFA